MRSFRLARVAAEAEVLRLRRMVHRLVIDAALLVAAALFVLAAFCLIHVAVFLLLEPRSGSLDSVLYLLAGDVAIAVLFGVIVYLNGPGRIERQALEVRQTARLQLAQSLTTGALLASATRAIGPRQLASIAGAVLQLLRKRAK